MNRHLVNAARYVRALGVPGGLGAWFTLYRSSRGEAVVQVPFLTSPIRARRGTVDVDVFDQIFVMRHYNLRNCSQWPVIQQKYQQIRARGRRPLIIDCGANIGMSALYFSHLFPEAAIVAIEPDAENFRMLSRNSAANPLILPVRAAVSDRPGWVSIKNPEAHAWAFQTAESVERRADSIPAITIADAASRVEDHEPLIVKVDIEGAEEQLFRSNTGWISTWPMLSIELHDWMRPWAGSSQSFFKALAGLDFDFVLAGENAFVFNWGACREPRAGAAA
jgi:FkbM family methyltransferase